ncbi:MAG: hypothetical protein IKS23_04645 [Alphaproteobacteria bacterium]|nr:hypothetical protein [Alphaproteobacteria bacterium]
MWRKFNIIALVLALGACGFEPLYVERHSDEKWYYKGEFDTSITDEISQIKVELADDRIGQLVRNELLDSFTPKGVPENPKYRLEIVHINKRETKQAMRGDITATRERVEYKLQYKLFDAQTGKQLVLGDTLALLGYDIMSNPYSTTFSQKKIEKDAAQIMANDISLRIGAYFHSVLTKRGNPNEL